MDTKRNWTTVTVVWMGVAALALGAFWHGWNLITGEIPVLTEVVWLTEKTSADGTVETPARILTLPLGLSRSWDMLGAAMFVWLGLWFCRWAEVKSSNREDLVFGLVFGLVAGLVAGLVVALGAGLVASLVFALAAGLVASLVAGLAVGLGYSFMIGLFWLGLLPGLAVFVIITAPLWLMAGSVIVYCAVKNRSRADWSGVKALLSGNHGQSKG